jgi:large subunit ribosomal protein L28
MGRGLRAVQRNQTQEGATNMSKVCEVCGKGPIVVNSVVRRGKARAAGGVGRKVTGVTKTRQVPNLQPLTVTRAGVSLRLRVCTKCRKSLI